MEMFEFDTFMKSLISLFIIVDPVGNIPIFLSLTSDIGEVERKKAFRKAVLTSFFILIIFGLVGDSLLHLFDVSVGGFQVAGGILLFVLSMKLLIQGAWEERHADPESRGIIPIAFPLLAGPGAITTVILILQRYGVLTSILSVLVVSLMNFIVLEFSQVLFRVLGKTGSAVISRITAVFISAIAAEYIITGAKALISSTASG